MSRARDLADRVLHNRTHEDTDGGRESILTFKGEQSGGEISTLAQIQASHDGTSDDEKADLIFKTNDGSDGASPTERVRVDSNGSILTATLGTDNVHLGEGAGVSIASGGANNVTVGKNAGTAITTGKKATLIGAEAGEALVDGDNNVAIGYQALTADTNGEKSVAVGTFALTSQNQSSLTDTHNTAVGYSAGQAVTTGDKNTVVGSLAGDALTTGMNNTVVGYSALGSNTASGAHVAIGYQALETMNSASNTSQFNVAVGTQAGKSVTTGTYNTFLGPQAGFNMTTGSKNTIVGQFDGNNHGLDIRTDSNTIVLSDGDGHPRGYANQNGYWRFVGENATAVGGSTHTVAHDNNDTAAIRIENQHGSFVDSVMKLNAHRTASSSYNLLNCLSGNAADNEFILRGDGNAYADGSWNGGGADYAEYFEWADGNSSNQDRTGYTVVLDNEKIRLATSDDAAANIIGAVSVNPSVIGDSDINQWKGKYLLDDFGAYIFEDYNVEDDDGNTVVQQRRKLNPDYDADQAYVAREDRQEWATIGMMGKLRIRKGQPTGDRWIKMRDVSDTVEEWLVR